MKVSFAYEIKRSDSEPASEIYEENNLGTNIMHHTCLQLHSLPYWIEMDL